MAERSQESGISWPVPGTINEYGILAGFILIVIYLSIATPTFLTYGNLITILRQTAPIELPQ